jgi:hypothetical protein
MKLSRMMVAASFSAAVISGPVDARQRRRLVVRLRSLSVQTVAG